MGNFFQFLANNLQLLFFIAVAIIPAVGALVRWIEQQRAERRRMAEIERRRLEALRTGRVEVLQTTMQPPRTTTPVPATAPRQTDAARRQREMQERMRQRLEQQRRQQQAPVRRGPAPATQRPGPVRQRPPARRAPAGQRSQRTQPILVDRRRARPSAQEAAPQTLTQTPTHIASQEIGSASAEPTGGPARVIPRVGPGMTVQQLREAIVLRELLDRPLALRDAGPGPDLLD